MERGGGQKLPIRILNANFQTEAWLEGTKVGMAPLNILNFALGESFQHYKIPEKQ